MGVSISVDVEGESSVPVEERTDAKMLAQIVGGLIRIPRAVTLLGLSSNTTESLGRIDESAYRIHGEGLTEAWQGPSDLKNALEEVRKALHTARANPSLIEELASGDYFYRENLEDYVLGLEDAIKICDWAIKRNKRVRLTAW